MTLQRLHPSFPEITREFYDKEMSGQSNELIVPKLLPQLNSEEQKYLWMEKEAEYRRLTGGGMTPMSGLASFLDLCERSSIKMIVVTNAPRVDAIHTLSMLNLFDRFGSSMVIGMECEEAKPHPAPYLEGLRRLGLSAEECIAFEDSPSGTKSARAANLPVVALLSSRSEEEMTSQHKCILAVRSFDDPRLLSLIHERLNVEVKNE